MNELRRDGRALLDEARRERTPDAVARERVYQALLASPALAAGAAPPSEPQPLAGPKKWLLLAALAAAVSGALYLAEHAGRKPDVAAPHAPERAARRQARDGDGAPSR